jgi:vibriolysin
MSTKPVCRCFIAAVLGLLLTGASPGEAQDAAETRIETARAGATTFLRGNLAYVGTLPVDDLAATERQMAAALAPALVRFRLEPADLRLRKINTDQNGLHHLRYGQVFNGLDVVGGELVVHVNAQGMIYAANGSARGDIPADPGKGDIGPGQARASLDDDARFLGMSISAPRAVFLITPEGATYRAYELVAEGSRGFEPVRDKVYVDAASGTIVAIHPQIAFLKNRRLFSANHGTSLPGTLRRSEGQAATSDPDVNTAYDAAGDVYDAYMNFWSRDSYDNAGATITSSVHYGTNYCNTFWNGVQLVYGDGNPADGCLPLARSIDAVAHEYTHAVTENESGLVLGSGEPAGLNESISDVFAAFTEAWVDGNRTGTLAVSADTWKIGEDFLPPALRYLNDPAADGASLDYWTSGAGNVDRHYSSGIANLAFYLMSQGGRHPRRKSSIVVAGVGMAKAIRVFYKANADYLTSNSNFAAAKLACENAARDLGFTTAEQASVSDAWRAVGVEDIAAPPTPIVLTNGVPVTGLADAQGGARYYRLDVPAGQTDVRFTLSGGSGDADLYVRVGLLPTTTSYGCRSFSGTSNETCTFRAAGTYFVMVRAYTGYSGVTLTGRHQSPPAPPPPPPQLVSETNLSGAQGSTRLWRVTAAAGRRLTVTMRGGQGDADLYLRAGSPPTTATWDCRPFLNANNETCTVPNTLAIDYHVMVRGFRSYSGVSLGATMQ